MAPLSNPGDHRGDHGQTYAGDLAALEGAAAKTAHYHETLKC
jgi:hypothetical protein